MIDIVERLRRERETDHLCIEAADEIERLRDHVNALLLVATSHEPEALRQQAEIDRLRTALQEIAEFGGAEDTMACIARRALEPKP